MEAQFCEIIPLSVSLPNAKNVAVALLPSAQVTAPPAWSWRGRLGRDQTLAPVSQLSGYGTKLLLYFFYYVWKFYV